MIGWAGRCFPSFTFSHLPVSTPDIAGSFGYTHTFTHFPLCTYEITIGWDDRLLLSFYTYSFHTRDMLFFSFPLTFPHTYHFLNLRSPLSLTYLYFFLTCFFSHLTSPSSSHCRTPAYLALCTPDIAVSNTHLAYLSPSTGDVASLSYSFILTPGFTYTRHSCFLSLHLYTCLSQCLILLLPSRLPGCIHT